MRPDWMLRALGFLLLACDDPARPLVPGAGPPVLLALGPGAAMDLGTLGGRSSFATDINNPGVVVGWSETASGETHAFRWTTGVGMADLGTLPGDVQSVAVSILNSGEILGWSLSAAGDQHPVIWKADGTIQPLEIPPITGAIFGMAPTDFNERGEVVGGAIAAEEHGWYWSRRTGTVDLRDQIPSCLENFASAINAGGLVAGSYCAPVSGWLHAFTWSPRRGHLDLGIVGDDIQNANLVALGLNNAGTIAGWIDPHGNVQPLPYLWTAIGGFTILPTLSAELPYGVARDVNSAGTAVGTSDLAQAVAWPSADSIVRLNGDSPLPSIATAINDRGWVAGWAVQQGMPGTIHAMAWSLRGGATTNHAAAPAYRPGRARASEADAGMTPESCLSERRALRSKSALIECILGRR